MSYLLQVEWTTHNGTKVPAGSFKGSCPLLARIASPRILSAGGVLRVMVRQPRSSRAIFSIWSITLLPSLLPCLLTRMKKVEIMLVRFQQTVA